VPASRFDRFCEYPTKTHHIPPGHILQRVTSGGGRGPSARNVRRSWNVVAIGPRGGHLTAMTTKLVELYEGLHSAGAFEDKAQAAAGALAEHDRRFARVDTKLAAIRGDLKALDPSRRGEMDHRGHLRRHLGIVLRTFVQG
jgi:hypothetical protein